jgi:hypothetical protein
MDRDRRCEREETIMSTTTRLTSHQEIEYPESDGEPMAEDTVQSRWITMIEGNLDIIFRQDRDVFVAGDLFWYPVENDNKTRRAPDVMVAFGRPKGDRSADLQWLEGALRPRWSSRSSRPEIAGRSSRSVPRICGIGEAGRNKSKNHSGRTTTNGNSRRIVGGPRSLHVEPRSGGDESTA